MRAKGEDESGYKDIEFSMQIDGEFPFDESRHLYFPKWLVSKTRENDFMGNQLRPVLKELTNGMVRSQKPGEHVSIRYGFTPALIPSH